MNPKRKNQCNEKRTVTREAKSVIQNMEDMPLDGLVEALDTNIRFKHVASFVFGYLLKKNKFAVWPNTKLHEIWFKDGNRVMVTSPGVFVMHFWKTVFQERVVPLLEREWPRFQNYKIDILQGPGKWDFVRTETYQVGMMNAFLKSDVYKDTKAAICGHLKQIPRSERAQLKIDMGTQTLDEALWGPN